MKIHEFSLFSVTLTRIQAGIISKTPLWVISHGGFMYINETLLGVIKTMATEYKDDNHLVG